MLWVGCAVVLALLWTVIVAVGLGRAELNRRHRAALAESTAKGFSEYVGLHLLLADRILLSVRAQFAVAGTIPAHKRLTADLGPMQSMLLQIAAADAQGDVVASSLPLSPGLSVADRAHFLEFSKDPRDRLFVSQPVVGRVSKMMSLQLVRPLLGPAGEFRGIIVASIDPTKLQQYFGSLDAFEDEGSVLIAGRTDGIVRVRLTQAEITWGQSLRGSRYWKELSQTTAGQYEVNGVIDHMWRLVGFHQVASYPLVVAVARKSPRWPLAEMALSMAIGIAFSAMQVLYTRSRVRRLREQEVLIEQLTQSRQREAESSRMKSRFLASISHELRTPLNAILGFSELLRDVPNHPENARRADLIHSSAHHLHALLNTMLDLAKIEAGRMEIHCGEVDLIQTVGTLTNVHRASAAKKGLSMTFESPLPATRTVLAKTDETRLMQVLNNVLSNAVKFTSSGGVRVSVSVDGGTFVVLVEDTGTGIPAEQLPLLFDRFSSASKLGSAKEEGTGLGLSLSRDLIRLLGGSIDIRSQPDVGTQVTVRLPGARLAETRT